MSQKIVDYVLDSLTPANPDASLPATVSGSAVVAGPGAVPLGTFPNALDFGAGGALEVALPTGSLDRKKFSVRVLFKVEQAVTARRTMVGCNALPFTLALVPGGGTSDFHLLAEVTTAAHGAGSASTEFFTDLHLNTWYLADLVYDTDTLAVFVDQIVYSVHAFPNGTVATGTGDKLSVESFGGALVVLQLNADLPIELESQLDERRVHPQWFLTYKQEEIKSSLAFGDPVGEFYYDLPSSAWIQAFKAGAIQYHDSNGQAFEMHGAILQAYWALSNRAEIGYLISDEINGAKGGSRKSLFSRGGLYWSRTTKAIPVIGQIWADYESLGESAALGMPVSPQAAIGGGWEQVFENGRMYSRPSASRAFEVHGAILAKYLASGGPAMWGFPVSNENDVIGDSGPIGRLSEFEGCTIFWSAGSGANEVHGDIRVRYRSVKGPAGKLGFPTSDEQDIAGGGRYNTFENGSILWFGSSAETYVALAFDITLGTVNTKESEGWGRGQNDLYMNSTIENNGSVIHTQRFPGSGDYGGHNIVSINHTFDLGPLGIVPNSPSCSIKLSLDVWDSDWPDDDDHLGAYSAVLDMSNAWGFRGNPSGLMNSGAFDSINSITWSVSPHVNEALLAENEKWWGVKNKGTNPITYVQYATAFRDVDSETEWWDPSDWLTSLFYEAVVDTLAKNGNCFGMSLACIDSKKDRSILRLPLDRFIDWESIRNEFNVKHQYQVGASAIWWFVGEFLSGKTHDPVSVFRATRDAYNAGCDPVLCIAQNYDFSGAPHCVLPIGWDDSVKPWRMSLHDPNFPSLSAGDPGPRVLNVDPDANTFYYDGGSNKYSGGEWSGGRMHYMPYHLLCERPRTPVYEALMLLLTGVILILGDDSETVSLTDEHGVDLDAYGPDSVARLQAGSPLTNKFVSVKGFANHTRECATERPPGQPRPEDPRINDKPRRPAVLTSELHMRSDPKVFSRRSPPNKRSGDDWHRITLREYLCQFAPADIREKFGRETEYVAQNSGRLMYRLADSKVVRAIIDPALKRAHVPTSPPTISPNYVHTTRNVRGGRLSYGAKQGLMQFLITGDAAAGEVHTFQVANLGSHNSTITIKGSRDKRLSLRVHNKLGAGRDHLRMTIDDIPLSAGGELKINIKPGIGGVELVSAGQMLNPRVNFTYVRRGVELRSDFELHEKDGLRFAPSTFITSNALKVNQINKLFGDSLNSKLVPALP